MNSIIVSLSKWTAIVTCRFWYTFIRTSLLTRCSKKLEDRCAVCSNCAPHTPSNTRLGHAHIYTVADPLTAQPVRASPRKKPGGAIPSLFVYRARSFAQFVFDIQRDQAGFRLTTTTILRFDSRDSNRTLSFARSTR